ncbi:3-hydroxyacyl-CoA dehydrogenase NAD-binding domain-containing protein [Thermomonospora umbrina]|uniref:Ketoreductase RED1 n=1 Tax=Thermomonospora umbrina TaxID=111806 RepID=A0A3D9SP70_9ACTN|nr:3-hydroxyacyl-CoA dehydrogenase NAD-binding domain-containing protein [Thermomonospora umbrina]REE96240.1 ketoreductase RED1 [Thermomonospora umbrina]
MTAAPRTVAVVAAGTIGLGWATLFLARGLDVRVNSRRPDARRLVAEALELHAPAVPGAAPPEALLDRLTVEPDLERALDGVDAVQENAPEDLELKQDLFARMERAAPADALLLSSTSTLTPAALGVRLKEPERVVVGHPFNPPHVVPLVEVVTGEAAPPELVERVVSFYRGLGKVPVVLGRALPGFAANRLQSALLREAVHLVREGVVTVEQLDTIVTSSIGLRWATIGPFQALHLNGGPGGLRHWLDHLGVHLEPFWEGLGRPPMDERTRDLLLRQADRTFGRRSFEDLSRERDRRQNAILDALGDRRHLPPPAR